jgi:uncharacterized protein (DUF488 family)
MEFYTIGVYGLTSEDFFQKLSSNNIDTFIDIRRRRAVRGSKFSFVNSKKLQNKLNIIGIKYIHVLNLSPTNQIRDLQKEADKSIGIIKRQRVELGDIFIEEYKRQILDKYELSLLIAELDKLNTKKAVLFCVEKEANACHRSLVSKKLETDFSYKINNL